ncbi:MAG: hypothetical protein H7A25_00390 [Leptospiraceae bacterium]|nr:hypothetical protein [Leptospiraceae bacterium]MCP5498334.1 hypothetical protein [Leptospiraceae bacterium]
MKITKGIFILLVMFSLSVLYAQDNTSTTTDNTGTATGADNSASSGKDAAKEEKISGELVPDDDTVSKDPKILRDERLWKNPDYKGYYKAFAELHKLSKAFANNKYRLALSAYQSGMNTILKMRDSVDQYRKEQAEKKRLDEKWYWQRVDRKAREENYIYRKKMEAKLAAVTYFTKAINHLDEIANPDLREKPQYKTLLSAIYRAWIMSEYDTKNYPQCIPILELYLEIDDNEKEYPAHKYLASCYSFEENVLKKYQPNQEELIQKYKYKKNVHLLRATELKYGKGSIEYKYIVDLVNRDEIISVTP